MTSKGRPSPGSAVPALLDDQVKRLAARHHLVDPTVPSPTGRSELNPAEVAQQNPRTTARLKRGCAVVLRASCRIRAWGLERVPAEGPFILAATHVTQFDVFIPMIAVFQMGRRPRFMAKAELTPVPLVGHWLRQVGMQPVPRHAGEARRIERESVRILTSGRPLTIWPEGTVSRDPLKWPMSLKPGVGFIALESSRQLGYQVPIFPCVTWGAASINHRWPWPKKNVVMCFDEALDYSDLLADAEMWGDEPPQTAVTELIMRLRDRMEAVMAVIRGEQPPREGLWDYRTMTRRPRRARAA